MTLEELHAVACRAVDRDRLVRTARRIMAVHSPTGSAGGAADCLAAVLAEDGFTVERHAAGHAAAPAVVVRFESGAPGRTLQFNGHLDTVHLPFVPPSIDEGKLHGTGACDMKGGLAAAVEALRAVRDAGLLRGGQILLVGHDLHEAPWGRGQQLDHLIRAGVHGDAVLIPEPCSAQLPIAGRGAAVWKVVLRREGETVHEVSRAADAPDMVGAGGRLIVRLGELAREISRQTHPVAGSESLFSGQAHCGEIYNQLATEFVLEGTRRWLAGADVAAVERQFRDVVHGVAAADGLTAEIDWQLVRGAFSLDPSSAIVANFETAYRTSVGENLPHGAKLFVDDGNSFSSIAGVPAITHGARAGGHHTVHEWASIDDLVRVAQVYALTAALYCPESVEATAVKKELN